MKAFARAPYILFVLAVLLSMAGCAAHPEKQGSAAMNPPCSGTAREENGWILVENHPTEVKFKVLLLPGLLCTDLIYADLLADPKLARAGVKLAAGDPPGFKGLPVKDGFDYSIENYAAEVESLAAVEHYDLIAGHSFNGNVLIEVAARGQYQGKLMLLSPSLRRSAEASDMRLMSRLVHIPAVGTFSMWASYRIMGSFYEPCMNDENHECWVDPLIAEGQKTPVPVATQLVSSFFGNIDRYGNLTPRLTSSKNRVWYVRGDQDRVILADEDRAVLNRSASVVVKDIPGGNHFIMIDRPADVSALILDILAGAAAPGSAKP